MNFNSDRYFDCQSAREDQARDLARPYTGRRLSLDELRATIPAMEAEIEFLRKIYAPRDPKPSTRKDTTRCK